MISPEVSVIIPAYNAEKTIECTLKALEKQDYSSSFEIIVIDDGSSDNTSRIVRTFPQVRYIHQDNAGPASARNRGASQAVGNVFLFTDSDCAPAIGWVRRMVEGFSNDRVAVVAGSYGIANAQFILARIIHEEILFRHQRLMPEFPRVFGSYNFAIRRDIFERVGGFNAGYRRASGEDNDLGYKIIAGGGLIRFVPDIRVDHFHQTDIRKYLQEQFRHGVWRVRTYIDYPQMVVGDGYTFWKDIVEIPVVFLSSLFFIFGGMFLGLGVVFFFLLGEILFGICWLGRFGIGVLAGGVFFLRAYARASGFIAGGVIFSGIFFRKDKKRKNFLRSL